MANDLIFMRNIFFSDRINQSVLFITYDGLLDPLGASQILPYLYSIADHPRYLHIISFEKPDRYRNGSSALSDELNKRTIGWKPLSYSTKGGKVAKAWDLLRMYAEAMRLQQSYKFDVIHCRSYQAMQVGVFLKHWFGVKVIFDMRGLWVDDRVDRGIWPQDKLTYRFLYKYYKRVERKLLEAADSIIVLTERVITDIYEISPNLTAKINVIPCCADFDHFTMVSKEARISVRHSLGIHKDALVISYLGSLGAVYLFDDMLRLFSEIAKKREDVHLIVITHDWKEEHDIRLVELGLLGLKNKIHIKSAGRDEVPLYLGASDVMLNFIRPTYSMRACSPTKMAEALAMGVPVISRLGVGDVDIITYELDAGLTLDTDDPAAFVNILNDITQLLDESGEKLRDRARKRLGLEVAKNRYCQVYDQLESTS